MTTTPIRAAERTRPARLRLRRLASPIKRMRVGTKLLLLAMLPVCCVAALVVVSAVSDFRTAHQLSSYRARGPAVVCPRAPGSRSGPRAARRRSGPRGPRAPRRTRSSSRYERATTQAFEQARARAVHVAAPDRRRGRPGRRAHGSARPSSSSSTPDRSLRSGRSLDTASSRRTSSASRPRSTEAPRRPPPRGPRPPTVRSFRRSSPPHASACS